MSYHSRDIDLKVFVCVPLCHDVFGYLVKDANILNFHVEVQAEYKLTVYIYCVCHILFGFTGAHSQFSLKFSFFFHF
jgi:hypothetical protein